MNKPTCVRDSLVSLPLPVSLKAIASSEPNYNARNFEMKSNIVRAQFVTVSNKYSQLLLQETPSQIITVLHAIYPLLIAANRILSSITWTTDSYCRNFSILFVYVLIVLHWNGYFIIILPLFCVFLFCCYAWFIKVTFIDTQDNSNLPPTLEEILETLENFTLRFSYLFNINKPPSAPYASNIRLFSNLCLLTPVYVYIMKKYLSINIWIVTITLYITTYHATWFIAFRKLLWRFKYIRKIVEFFTGENYSMVDKDLEITILNMNTKGSIDEHTKIIEFNLVENERRWIGIGWSKCFLFFEQILPYYNTESKTSFYDLSDFQFPVLKNYRNSEWKWLDEKWLVDSRGWTYYDNYWKHPQSIDSITKYTRNRRLRRQCLVRLQK